MEGLAIWIYVYSSHLVEANGERAARPKLAHFTTVPHNIIVTAPTFKMHFTRLTEVFQRLKITQLTPDFPTIAKPLTQLTSKVEHES